MVKGAKSVIGGLIDVVKGVFGKIKDIVGGFIKKAWQWGKDLMKGKMTIELTDVNTGETETVYEENLVTDAVQGQLANLMIGVGKGRLNTFSGKVICGECGGVYGRKVWHSNDKYRRMIWRCNDKYVGSRGIRCHSPHFTEEELQTKFIKALSKMKGMRDNLIEDMQILKETATNTQGMVKERDQLGQQMEQMLDLIEQGVVDNSMRTSDQQAYEGQYNTLVGQYEDMKARYDEVSERIIHAETLALQIDDTIGTLRNLGDVTEFDETLWGSLVESMTIIGKEEVVLRLRGGVEVRA